MWPESVPLRSKKLLYQCSQQRLASCCQHRYTLLMSATIVYGCSQSILIQSLLTTTNKLISSTIVVSCSNNVVTTIVLCRTTIDRTILMNIINSTNLVRLSSVNKVSLIFVSGNQGEIWVSKMLQDVPNY